MVVNMYTLEIDISTKSIAIWNNEAIYVWRTLRILTPITVSKTWTGKMYAGDF